MFFSSLISDLVPQLGNAFTAMLTSINRSKGISLLAALATGSLLLGTSAQLTYAEVENEADIEQEDVSIFIDTKSAEQSEAAAHSGKITKELTVSQEENDTPANHLEKTLVLPNGRIIFRVIESAEASSNAVSSFEATIDQSISQ